MGSRNLGLRGPVRVDDLAVRHSFRLVELHLKASYLYIGSAAQLQERLQAASTWQGGAVSINPDAPSTRNS